MITEDYVSFETAKLLKEKGFNELCRYYYSSKGKMYRTYGLKDRNYTGVNTYSAPTLQMTMKWLREEHNIFIQISAILQDQPFQKVLVRNTKDNIWLPDLFGFYDGDNHFPFRCISGYYKYCIPYCKELLGTSKDYKL